MGKLNDAEIAERMTTLAGWELRAGKLRREIEFADFVHAFGFMTSLALAAESRNHHPEWSNVYNRVTIEWNTHDVGGLSDLDFELARITDALANAAAQ
jgi:4a-hydroxytetrahydrobiopterin dehydratase